MNRHTYISYISVIPRIQAAVRKNKVPLDISVENFRNFARLLVQTHLPYAENLIMDFLIFNKDIDFEIEGIFRTVVYCK